MFKINKDLIFWAIAILWLIGNIIEYYITKQAIIVNYGFITLMAFVILLKNHNHNFDSWLNKPLKK